MLDGQMVQGNNINLRFVVTDENGSKLDLSGVVAIVWSMKSDITSEGATLTKILGDGIELTDPEDGEFMVTLTAEDTEDFFGTFIHEAVLTMDDDSNCTVTNGGTELEYGSFVIRQRITSPA